MAAANGRSRIYTPDDAADAMLDLLGGDAAVLATGPDAPLVDPACGHGALLAAVVRRAVRLTHGPTLDRILAGIHGVDLDPDAVAACRDALGVASAGRHDPRRIVHGDALDGTPWAPAPVARVLANPPYVRFRHLDAAMRAVVRATAGGLGDLYMAFVDRIAATAADAVILVPASLTSARSAAGVRGTLIAAGRVASVVDHGHGDLFATASVRTCFLRLGRPGADGPVLLDGGHRVRIPPAASDGRPWNAVEHDGPVLGDMCRIEVGIATLADKVFVVRGHGGVVPPGSIAMVETTIGCVPIETAILAPVVKATGERDLLLRPYVVHPDGRHEPIPEPAWRRSFPLAAAYVDRCAPILDRRDAGKPIPGGRHLFGRTQGLLQTTRERLLFGGVVKDGGVRFHRAPPGTYCHGGYTVSAVPGGPSLDTIATVMRSAAFATHLRRRGLRLSDGWFTCGKSHMVDFPWPGDVRGSTAACGPIPACGDAVPTPQAGAIGPCTPM